MTVVKKPRNITALRNLAERIGIRVISDLKASRISKIDINTVKAAVDKDKDCPKDAASRGELISMTLRRIVEAAAK